MPSHARRAKSSHPKQATQLMAGAENLSSHIQIPPAPYSMHPTRNVPEANIKLLYSHSIKLEDKCARENYGYGIALFI
jgi:hypothetical protein